jgi:hypothetical protein
MPDTVKFMVLEDDPNRVEQFQKRFREFSERNGIHVSPKFTDNVDDFMVIMRAENFDVVFMDHDLGGRVFVDSVDKTTGAEAARQLKAKGLVEKNGNFIIHSLNQAGALNIANEVGGRLIPFVWLRDVFHEAVRYRT